MMVRAAVFPEIQLSDPFIRGLACAALSPGLRGVLLFDAAPDVVRWAGAVLRAMRSVVAGQAVSSYRMGVIENDDSLWGYYRPKSAGHWLEKLGQPILFGGREAYSPQIIIVPDLTRLNLAAARAAIMVMDTPAAGVERHGQHEIWQPDILWLAACPRRSVGQVSPHLLDRFALRLSPPAVAANSGPDRVSQLRARLESTGEQRMDESVELPADVVAALESAVQHLPQISPETTRYLVETYRPAADARLGVRRDIALGRLAVAIARLDGVAEVNDEHVDEAAALMNITPEKKSPEPKPAPEPPAIPDNDDTDTPKQAEKPPSTPSEPVKPLPQSEIPPETPVYESDTATTFPESALPSTPYPEDTAPIEREIAPLRFPVPRHNVSSRQGRGIIIGTRKAARMEDIALVATIIEAAKFKKIRNKDKSAGQGIIIKAEDFRSYRRLPVTENLLLLLIDYTSLQDCDWEESLLPYLRWAYVNRAAITIIQVGNDDGHAGVKLRANVVSAPKLRVPHVEAALSALPGRATPLAHGLYLADQVLNKVFQQGKDTVQFAQFVLLTDGRGNVPLEASQTGKITLPVNREGVDDAIRLAYAFREFRKVRKVLLNPQPQQYAELPEDLAVALGAEVENIPLRNGGDV